MLGAALVAYGVTGLVMLAVIGLSMSAPIDAIARLGGSVESQREAALEALDSASETISGAAGGVRNMDGSLGQARSATDRSAVLSRGVAASMYQLAEAMTISLFGTQPLIGLSTGFFQTGSQLIVLADDLSSISEALDQNRDDALAVARSLDELAVAVDRLTLEVRDGPRVEVAEETVDGLRLGILALLIWLGLLAVGAIGAGAWCWWLARGQDVGATPEAGAG